MILPVTFFFFTLHNHWPYPTDVSSKLPESRGSLLSFSNPPQHLAPYLPCL